MKRWLLFLLLVATGSFVLWLAAGENVVLTGPQVEVAPRGRDTGRGIQLQQEELAAEGELRGPLRISETRDVQQGNDVLHLPVYDLAARDSLPVGNGMQRLDDLVVKLFERGRHAADLTAVRAFVQLGADARGRPSLQKDKDLDLREAVLKTVPGSRLEGLQLTLPAVRVRIRETELELHTPGERDPVSLELAGARGGTATGLGLSARLPNEKATGQRRAELVIHADPVLTTSGAVVRSAGPLRYVEELALGAAQVTMEREVRIEFTGETGGLALPVGAPFGAGAGGKAEAGGDLLTVSLVRQETQPGRPNANAGADARANGDGAAAPRGAAAPGPESMAWRLLRLDGAPAYARGGGASLASKRLLLRPGPEGQPYLLTAALGPARLEQAASPGVEHGPGAAPGVFTAERQIHVVRPGDHLGAWHRQLGFPAWSLRPLHDLQLAVFEGASQADAGPGQKLHAADGLAVVRPDPALPDLFAYGRGAVRIELAESPAAAAAANPTPGANANQPANAAPAAEPLVATGNDGFALARTANGDTLALGPPADAPAERLAAHAYDLRRGGLHVAGTGACRFDRAADGGVRAALAAAEPTIAADLGPERGKLRNLTALDVELTGGEASSLVAAGVPAAAEMVRAGETVLAEADRIFQTGPSSYRLVTPAGPAASGLPSLRRALAAGSGREAEAVALVAPVIDLHRLHGDHVLVEAMGRGLAPETVLVPRPGQEPLAVVPFGGDRLARAEGAVPRPDGGKPGSGTFAAARIRLLPFAVPGTAIAAHASALPRGVVEAIFAPALRPWLLAERVERFELVDADQGKVAGHGARVVLSEGAAAALLAGDPETRTPAEVTSTFPDGREAFARGARVRIFGGQPPEPPPGDAPAATSFARGLAAARLSVLTTFVDGGEPLAPWVRLRDPKRTAGADALADVVATCEGAIDVLGDAVLFHGPASAHSLLPDGSEDPLGLRVDAARLRMARDPATGEIVRVLADESVTFRWRNVIAESREVDLDLRRERVIARDPEGASVRMGDRWYRAPYLEANYRTMVLRAHHARAGQDPTESVAPR